MDNKNKWTKFCDDMNQSATDVKNDFKNSELTFVDNASKTVIDEKTEEQLDDMKNYAADLAGDGKKEELRNKIEELLVCIRERDKKISQLKKDADDNKTELGDWYNKAKHDCEELSAKLEKYTSEKLGILSLFADVLKEVVDKDGFYLEKAKIIIKDKIREEKRSGICRFAVCATLLLVVLAVIWGLFVLIGVEKGLCGINPTILGKWIAVGFIVVFLVLAVFLIIRICALIKNCKEEIQRLQSLLDKIGTLNMTKQEIDHELGNLYKVDRK